LDVAASYQNIGESLCKLGDFQGALAAYRESLSILESLLGENHANVAIAHSLLGGVLYNEGDVQLMVILLPFGYYLICQQRPKETGLETCHRHRKRYASQDFA
jgi:tetratricopeptide (TPR) repeat protein